VSAVEIVVPPEVKLLRPICALLRYRKRQESSRSVTVRSGFIDRRLGVGERREEHYGQRHQHHLVYHLSLGKIRIDLEDGG